nr:hypothetical protein [Paenalcaligenes hominis]
MRHSMRKLAFGAALVASAMSFGVAQANDAIKFAAPLDYTAVYTFLTNEYAQGQKDYLRMINDAGVLKGRKSNTPPQTQETNLSAELKPTTVHSVMVPFYLTS